MSIKIVCLRFSPEDKSQTVFVFCQTSVLKKMTDTLPPVGFSHRHQAGFKTHLHFGKRTENRAAKYQALQGCIKLNQKAKV